MRTTNIMTSVTEEATTIPTPNPFITVKTESPPAWKQLLSVYQWEVVDGWFAEYPLSIGMNRSFIFDNICSGEKFPILDLHQSIKRLMNV